MPYIVRKNGGEIIALLKESPFDHAEFLAADHPDVAAFIGEAHKNDPQQALAESDHDLARVIEDLVQLLVHKNTIMFTDLPLAVQQKLLNREKLRSSLNDDKNGIWDEDEGLI